MMFVGLYVYKPIKSVEYIRSYISRSSTQEFNQVSFTHFAKDCWHQLVFFCQGQVPWDFSGYSPAYGSSRYQFRGFLVGWKARNDGENVYCSASFWGHTKHHMSFRTQKKNP